MKITINGKIDKKALKSILDIQKEKTEIINEFCKKEKIKSFTYKDSELEYNYLLKPKAPNNKNKKVETRDVKKN